MRALLLLIAGISSATASNQGLTNTGCVDPSGFDACQAAVNKQTTQCINQANHDSSQVELVACNCQDSVANINCYAAHCWNRVWECEYQDFVVGYLQACPVATLPVPYFPIAGAPPDACSCNLGEVYLGMQNAITQTGQCSNNAQSGDAASNLQQIQGCNCCELSGSLSSILNICPDTNPSLIGANTIPQLSSQLNTDFDTCGQYLETYDCASALGYSLAGVSTWYGPSDSVRTGTATLSNGAGTVSSPASGSIFTWSNGGDKQVYTVTAAGVGNGGKSGSNASGQSNGGSTTTSASAIGSSATSGSAASATASTSPSDKNVVSLRTILWLGLLPFILI